MVFYSVHPTAMRHDVPLMSADLAGRAMSQLERTWPVAGFFNGAEGDLSPDWKSQRREDVIDFGDKLAQAVGTLAHSPNLAADLSIDAERREFANDWRHERPNGQPKLATQPTPGAPVFGGAEDGRAGILYQQDWRGGMLSRVPNCETQLDQGCKVPALDYPLHEFLKIWGLPTWLNTIPVKLHLTGWVSRMSFPEQLPVGWVRFGKWLSLATLPVEMTTAMARRLRESFPGEQRIAIVGLANEYFSYAATPDEYKKQQYEGASTLSGPQEGPALIEMLQEVSDQCKNGQCHQDRVNAYTYRVGPYPTIPFGPRMLKPPRNMVDEDMDPFAPWNLAESETQVPRAEWEESAETDWQSHDRRVSVWRMDGPTPSLVDDESSWNFLTVLKDSTGGAHGTGTRVWNSLWLLPKDAPRAASYFFRVHVPTKGDVCSAVFRLSDRKERVPVEVQHADRACPPPAGR